MIFAVLSLVITLWNANTSYETSPKFLTSRSHFCEHFKELRINNTGGTVVYFSDCWGTQILWEVSLGKRNIWSEAEFAPPTGKPRGTLKQCRETRVSSLPFLSTPPSRPAAVLAWGATWSLPSPWPWLTGEELAAGWHGLLWLKPPGELNRSLLLPKCGHEAAVCRCGTLLSWPSMLEAALDPPCWVHPVLQGDANDQGEDPGAKLHLAELEG